MGATYGWSKHDHPNDPERRRTNRDQIIYLNFPPTLEVRLSVFLTILGCNRTLFSLINCSTPSGLPFLVIDFLYPAFHTGLFMV